MKKVLKAVMCLLLVLTLVLVTIPASAFAASDTFIEVTKNNAPARSKRYESGTVLKRYEKGTILKATPCRNGYGNLWYAVTLENGRTVYIYSKNVREHKHSFKDYSTGIGTFQVCERCGHINVKSALDAKKVSLAKRFAINALIRTRGSGVSGIGQAFVDTLLSVNKSNADPNVLRMTSLALPLMAIDGPFPAGDIVAAVLVASAEAVAILGANSMSKMNSAVDIQTFITGITAAEFLELLEKSTTQCSPYTFKRVVRAGNNLKYVDRKCINAVEAYICVVLGIDVYTSSPVSAKLLADMFTITIMEHDKDKPTHYWHYHACTEQGYRIHSHIFYGTNDRGQVPHY